MVDVVSQHQGRSARRATVNLKVDVAADDVGVHDDEILGQCSRGAAREQVGGGNEDQRNPSRGQHPNP
jgi:hypothetical protein